VVEEDLLLPPPPIEKELLDISIQLMLKDGILLKNSLVEMVE
tara:strand:+ start:301 stop:426 length:126 start_codon:yes stop_codon:yes gene_type:complete